MGCFRAFTLVRKPAFLVPDGTVRDGPFLLFWRRIFRASGAMSKTGLAWRVSPWIILIRFVAFSLCTFPDGSLCRPRIEEVGGRRSNGGRRGNGGQRGDGSNGENEGRGENRDCGGNRGLGENGAMARTEGRGENGGPRRERGHSENGGPGREPGPPLNSASPTYPGPWRGFPGSGFCLVTTFCLFDWSAAGAKWRNPFPGSGVRTFLKDQGMDNTFSVVRVFPMYFSGWQLVSAAD